MRELFEEFICALARKYTVPFSLDTSYFPEDQRWHVVLTIHGTIFTRQRDMTLEGALRRVAEEWLKSFAEGNVIERLKRVS